MHIYKYKTAWGQTPFVSDAEAKLHIHINAYTVTHIQWARNVPQVGNAEAKLHIHINAYTLTHSHSYTTVWAQTLSASR